MSRHKLMFSFLFGVFLTFLGQEIALTEKRRICTDKLISALDNKEYILKMLDIFERMPTYSQAYVFHEWNVNNCILDRDNGLE